VVRLSGPQVGAFLANHFSAPVRLLGCVHGQMRNRNRVIDDPVVVLLEGDRGAEVNLHGGPWVVQEFLELAKQFGFEVAGSSVRGAVDLEAVDGSTLIEREMLAHLPSAKTELALNSLLAQPDAWKSFVKEQPSVEQIAAIVADRGLWWLLHPPRVAIVGLPNAGKSTLANQLFAQERSIVTDAPGTTRDWVGELANIDGLLVMLVDTPGLRQTNDAIEATAMHQAKSEIARADLVIHVVDVTRTLKAQVMAFSQASLTVANKVDLVGLSDPTGVAEYGIVAKTGSGIGVLRTAIHAHFNFKGISKSSPRWWTQRQLRVLQAAQADRGALSAIIE